MSDTLTESEIKENLKTLFALLRAPKETDVDDCISLIEDTFPTEGREEDLQTLLLAIFALLVRDTRLAHDGFSDGEFDDLAGELAMTDAEKERLRVKFVVPPIAETPALAPYRYYSVTARHDRNTSTPRRKPDVRTDFTGTIHTIRVELPKDMPKKPKVVRTSIGVVSSKDHVVFSVQELNQKRAAVYGGDLLEADAAHLITGGRRGLNRFTPVSLYLCYRAGTLIYWALQSSTFVGVPAYLYVARDMDGEIGVQSNYQPTPFAYKQNMYTMRLRMNGDDPEELSGELWSHSAQEASIEHVPDPPTDPPASIHYRKYMTMTVSYEREDDPKTTSQPMMAQTEAFCRVCRIEDWVELEHYKQPVLGELAKLLHKTASAAGDRLRWRVRPPKSPAPVQDPPQ